MPSDTLIDRFSLNLLLVEPQIWLCIALAGLGFGLAVKSYQISRKRLPGEPPLVPGKPLLGNGMAFRKNVVPFLLSCRETYGDVFTLMLPMNTCIHYIMNPLYIAQFTNQRNFDFLNIQATVNSNVFGFRTKNHKVMLLDLTKSAKKAYSSDIYTFADKLNKCFHSFSDNTKSAEKSATSFLVDTMFQSIFASLYGDKPLSKEFNYKTVAELSFPIKESFRFKWLGFPSWLFRTTVTAWKELYRIFPDADAFKQKEDLSNYLKQSTKFWDEESWSYKNLVGYNMVLLHVYYNNCKLGYWMMNFWMSYPEEMKILQEEIDAAVGVPVNNGSVSLSLNAIESLPYLNSFFLETSRLSSGLFIIREVSADTNFECSEKSYKMRKGDLVTVFQPAFYRDNRIFSDPENFKIDRFLDDNFEYLGQRIRNPVLPFGILCPAKKFAMMEMKLFMIMLVANFRLESCSKPAVPDVTCYGDEILPPSKETENLRFRLIPRRNEFYSIQLEEE